MAAYNKVILVGNLTRDPEYKQLPSGQAVCRLGIAVNRQFKNKQSGDTVQEVCYIDIDVWGAQADNCKNYLTKGRPILVEGRLKLDSWQDQDGKTRSKHSIVGESVTFLGSQSTNQTSESYEGASLQQDSTDFEPRNDVEKALKAQLDDIKNRKNNSSLATKTPLKKMNTQEQAHQDQISKALQHDEPPFDDLPF